MIDIDIFKQDTASQFQVIQLLLLNNKSGIEDKEDINELFRALHSLKGTAMVYNLDTIVKLVHKSEDILTLVRKNKIKFDSKIRVLFKELYDVLMILIDISLAKNKISDIVQLSISSIEQKLQNTIVNSSQDIKEEVKYISKPVDEIVTPELNILLVDDMAINTALLKLLVEEWFEDNYLEDYLNIDTAKDGEIALDMVGEKRYDVVFMDIMMPNMDGISSLQGIRLLDLECQPIVIMATALMDDKTKLDSHKAGANAFVTKPIKYNMVTMVLDKYIDKDVDKVKGTACLISPDNIFNDFDKVTDKVTAKEFLKDFNTTTIVEDIEDLHHNLSLLINNLKHDNINENLEVLLSILLEFRKILTNFADFDGLSELLIQLKKDLFTINFNNIDEKSEKKLFEYLNLVLEDTESWTSRVFITQDEEDVFYINKSVLSNCMQLESIIKENRI